MIKFGHAQISTSKMSILVLKMFHFWDPQSSKLEMQDSHQSFYITIAAYIEKVFGRTLTYTKDGLEETEIYQVVPS